MKKMMLPLLMLVLSLAFTSGCRMENNMAFSDDCDEKIADASFDKIISAVRLKDDSEIVDIFSNSVKSECELSQSATEFINFIHGDIISFSSASESGVGADLQIENGKKRKEIQSSFCINTTESKYYVAVKECVGDEFDDNNVGVTSIYIIESGNWANDYVYRGDGQWTRGINITVPICASKL